MCSSVCVEGATFVYSESTVGKKIVTEKWSDKYSFNTKKKQTQAFSVDLHES